MTSAELWNYIGAWNSTALIL